MAIPKESFSLTRALLISVLSFLFIGVFGIPSEVQAASDCGFSTSTATGYFFTPFESVSYSAEGYPIYHFQISESYTDGRPFRLFWGFLDDECKITDVNTYFRDIGLPTGVSKWSVRFTSKTHFDVWDDQYDTILMSRDIGSYPDYTQVYFFGSINGGISTLGSSARNIKNGGLAPVQSTTLTKPTPCNAISGGGYLFDAAYEHAEYINGLLQVHLRLKGPYNDGRFFTSNAFYASADCAPVTSGSGSVTLNTGFTPYAKYYSFRMVTPTSWELWDDETNTAFSCAGCSGTIPSDASFVGWQASVDGGASTISTTPFSPSENESCSINCSSNILFIPGFEGSRLYTKTNGTENELWEPGISSFQGDAKKLNLNPDGTSINSVYTKSNAAIDTIDVPFGSDIEVYKTFLAQLNTMQGNGVFAAHEVFPYDWRMSVQDIVEEGTQYEGGTHFLEDSLTRLASSSSTGKVTIVAHSNGGLVAKALMQKLEKEGKANLVDKILFVGTPQLGTPKTVASMLNGDFQDFPGGMGFMVSKSTARDLAHYMPAAYGLLPSDTYFARVATPVVTGINAPELMNSAGITDVTIDDAAPFKQFLTSTSRTTASSDVEKPAILSNTLLNQASAIHDSLDSWTPPPGVEAIQVVGWGLDTPSGITYTEKKNFVCSPMAPCSEITKISHSVDMIEDGDETVVSVSAAANPNWKTYYVDLHELTKVFNFNYRHLNFTEAPTFQNLFKTLLSSTSPTVLPQFVSNSQPQNRTQKRLLLRVLSPVSLDAYDSNGNHTGLLKNPNPLSDLQLKEENIINSYYEEFGEGKYIGLPAEGQYRVDLKGLDVGTFTLEMRTTGGGEPDQVVIYKDLPVTASSTAVLTVTSTDITQSVFTLDVNGDGTAEKINSFATTTNPLAYIGLIKESVSTMALGTKTKKQLLLKLTNTESLIKKSAKWDDEDDDGREPELKKSERPNARILKKIDKISAFVQVQLAKSDKKSGKDEYIAPEQAAGLLNMLSDLKSLVQ